MKANAFLVLIWLVAAAIGYRRLPDLLSEYTSNWQPYQVEMLLTSGALCIGAVSALAILVTMCLYGRKPR